MRQIGTLADGDDARTLADYLLTLKIETRLEEQPEGWLVWVCDEDRVSQARAEFAEFQRDPHDPRFGSAARAAQEIRLREITEEDDYRRRLAEFREQMTERPPRPRYVTAALLAGAVFVTLLTHFGEKTNQYVPFFWIDSNERATHLTQVWHGEIWRLVTPIFVHMDVMHLIFNCLCISTLAGQVERVQGSGRLLWLVAVFAVLSNLTQFYFGHPTWEPPVGLILRRSPLFGGLSGVAYGLFGYVWMKTRFAPDMGMFVTPGTVVIMVVWYFACLTGVLGPIANAAHSAGLALGIVIGAGPHVFDVLRRR
jgi:GlpG protein